MGAAMIGTAIHQASARVKINWPMALFAVSLASCSQAESRNLTSVQINSTLNCYCEKTDKMSCGYALTPLTLNIRNISCKSKGNMKSCVYESELGSDTMGLSDEEIKAWPKGWAANSVIAWNTGEQWCAFTGK
jgi:hypothetical protein